MEGDDWVRERTEVMKPTVMTSSINARAISVAGSGGLREMDRVGLSNTANRSDVNRECQEISEQNGRSLKETVGRRDERNGSQRA